MAKIRVRIADKKDALSIAKLHFYSSNALYYELFEANPTEAFNIESRKRYWENRIPESVSDALSRVVLVAELLDNTLIGFVSISIEKSIDGVKQAHLDSIYIYSTFHRYGVGTMLFHGAKRKAQELGATFLYVWVLEKNPACSFYQKLGGKKELSANSLTIGGLPTREIAYSWTLCNDTKSQRFIDNEFWLFNFSTNISDFLD